MNKKYLLKTIKKIAQELDWAPGTKPAAKQAPANVPVKSAPDLSEAPGTETKTVPNVPTQKSTITHPGLSGQSRPISYSVPAVKEMQQAILDFANVASSTDITSMKGNQEGQQTGNQSRELYPTDPNGLPLNDGGAKEHLGGNEPFGNFIIQNYLPKDAKGKQLLNVDVSGKVNRDYQSTYPMNLRGLIDSIKRIGSPGSKGTEKSVDGIWQNRTNNALHAMGDLTEAMLNLTADMKISAAGFDQKKLEEFRKRVPYKYTDMKSQEQIIEIAKSLIPLIKDMTVYFNDLKPKVLENKDIKKYIDQKEPFAKYKNVKYDPQLGASELPGIKFDFIKDQKQNWISLQELSNMDNFKKFLARVGVGQDPATIKEILGRLDRSLNIQKEPGY